MDSTLFGISRLGITEIASRGLSQSSSYHVRDFKK